MSKKVMSKEYEVHYYEVDFRKQMQITSLIDFLGDIATDQSERLGVGMDYLFSNGLGWVLYKWDINVYSYPRYGEKIVIKTMPYGFRRFYAYRIFEVFNESGELIAEASSIWFLLDIQKKKPVRIESNMYEVYGIPENCKDMLDVEEILKPENIQEEKVFNVRYSDIDTNKHVNNSKYASWAIEVMPLDIVLNYTLKRIKVTYQKETKYGETVRSKLQINNCGDKAVCNHSIEDKEGNILALLETIWEKV
jgi:medium-chain acyl-[acyl-carrier-protein] hydrolase